MTTLKTITLKSFNGALTLASVPLSRLAIPRWQRTELHTGANFKKIGAAFDPQVGGVITITPQKEEDAEKDGYLKPNADGAGFWVLNGSRRTASLQAKYPHGVDGSGAPIRLAAILVDVVPHEQPLWLEKLNKNTQPITANAIFKANLHAGEPIEVFIVDALAGIGVSVIFARGSFGGGATNSPGTLRSIYDQLGRASFSLLTELLTVFQEPDGGIEPDALRPDFFKALALLIQTVDREPAEIKAGLKNGPTACEAFSTPITTDVSSGSTGHSRARHLCTILRRGAQL